LSNNAIAFIKERSHSQSYLKIAKTIVEKAIKTDEEIAINWGDEQLKTKAISFS